MLGNSAHRACDAFPSFAPEGSGLEQGLNNFPFPAPSPRPVLALAQVHVRIFDKNSSSSSTEKLQAELQGSEVFARRPTVGEECALVARECNDVGVYACGPSAMVADFETQAFRSDMPFHKEYFLF